MKTMLLIGILTAVIVAGTQSAINLQLHSESRTIGIGVGPFAGTDVTLTNLNPWVNAWYLLSYRTLGKGERVFFHLENPRPSRQRIRLDPNYPAGLVVVEGGEDRRYPLCAPDGSSVLESASAVRQGYVAICDGSLYLRNRMQGHKTPIEWTTDLLRTYVPGGETVIDIAKVGLFKDRYFTTARLHRAMMPEVEPALPAREGPVPALIDSAYAETFLYPPNLGIEIDSQEQKGVLVGQWYPVKNSGGMFVSVVQPRLVSAEPAPLRKRAVMALDDVEGSSLSYLVAFDLDRYDLNFVMGTDHPGVDWSAMVNPGERVGTRPGPDGIGTVWPLVMTGYVPPYDVHRTVATFAGGFRRYHGAFRYGPLSEVNRGSHYGFIENGVVLSRLQPGLATVAMYRDGAVVMKTWREDDSAGSPRIKHARQNGVALVEFDSAAGMPRAGSLVWSWGHGNWSGSKMAKLRTLRAGIAIQHAHGRRFLIYGFFTTATPSAMARVFLAYRCDYAMLTDMNALEHTYLAVYQHDFPTPPRVQHLIKGMESLDLSTGRAGISPRFIAFPDSRDFFYLARKQAM